MKNANFLTAIALFLLAVGLVATAIGYGFTIFMAP